jgi:hypothetical protein
MIPHRVELHHRTECDFLCKDVYDFILSSECLVLELTAFNLLAVITIAVKVWPSK